MNQPCTDYFKMLFNANHEQVLAGRTALCQCGSEQPSSLKLAFFAYRGLGSDIVHQCAEPGCGRYDYTHLPINPGTSRDGITDHAFIPRTPFDTDLYYCGCKGWD